MMKSWPVLMLACLAACGDSTAPSDRLAREFAFDDPAGDTAVFAGSVDSFPALDVRHVSGVVTADSLTFTMEFTAPISPASDVAPNSLVATFGIDADDDSTTGIPGFTEDPSANADVGLEYWVFVDTISNGAAEVQSIVTSSSVGVFPASYGANSMTMRIPLSAIGVRAGDRFRIVGIVGTLQRSTDLIPNSKSYILGGSS